MLTREEIIEILRENQSYLAAEFGVKTIGLFGSYAKGRPNEASDVDVFVEFRHPIGFRFVELAEYLEYLLGRKVDMLTPAGIQGIRTAQVAKTLLTISCMSERTDIDFLSDIQEGICPIAA